MEVILNGTPIVSFEDITFGGVVSFPDGSASLPSIANDGDANTGMWFSAADTINLSVAGAEIAEFDAASITFVTDLVFTQATPEILGGDADGELFISPSTTNALGGNIVLYSQSHSSKPNDIEFRTTAALHLSYDDSANLWNMGDGDALKFGDSDNILLGDGSDASLGMNGSDTILDYDIQNAGGIGFLIKSGSTTIVTYDDEGTRITYGNSLELWQTDGVEIVTASAAAAGPETSEGSSNSGWAPGGGALAVRDGNTDNRDVWAGRYALNWVAAGNTHRMYSAGYSLTAGTKYRVSYMVKNSSTGFSTYISTSTVSGGAIAGAPFYASTATADWRRHEFEFTAPTTATHYLVFYENSGNTTDMELDHVSIRSITHNNFGAATFDGSLMMNGADIGIQQGNALWLNRDAGTEMPTSAGSGIRYHENRSKIELFGDDVYMTHALELGQDIMFSTSQDSAVVADEVTLGGYELSAGNRALAISQEAPVVAAVTEADYSHAVPVRINGTTYHIMLASSLS